MALARRFKDSLTRTLQFLSGMPGLGIRYEEAGPKYGELRCWPVNGFPNHLIFYRPVANGIEVLRIVHGARNLQRLFNR